MVNDSNPFVYVVDDDRSIRASLVALLNMMGVQARPFVNAADLLDALDSLDPGLLLLDIRMPGTSGIDLLQQLRARHCCWPVAIMTGHGEIPLAVRAVKLGAIEFLEKPFSSDALEGVVRAGLAQLPASVVRSRRAKAAAGLGDLLSPRQRQVFDGVVEGLTSKEIAKRYGLSPRTVESYRLDMMKKLGVERLIELVELKASLMESRFVA